MKMQIIIPANGKENIVEIESSNYKMEIWYAKEHTNPQHVLYEPVCEGIIYGLNTIEDNVPQIILEILKFAGKIAFFTRENYCNEI